MGAELEIVPEIIAVHTGLIAVPVFIIIVLTVVLKISRPFAGEAIAFCSVVVKRGISNPFVVLLTSSIALPSGLLPVALIPTFCAKALMETARKRITVKRKLVFIFLNIEFLYGTNDGIQL
jgi:hypothetical protein